MGHWFASICRALMIRRARDNHLARGLEIRD
jgi:hypothetical protein